MSEKEKNEGGGLSGLLALAFIGYLGYQGFNYIFAGEKDELKEYLKCRLVARELGENQAVVKIQENFEKFALENRKALEEFGSPARLSSFLHSEIRKELDLRNKNTKGRLYTLVKAYNSCSNIHEQEKLGDMDWDYYYTYIFL